MQCNNFLFITTLNTFDVLLTTINAIFFLISNFLVLLLLVYIDIYWFTQFRILKGRQPFSKNLVFFPRNSALDKVQIQIFNIET